MSVNCVSCMTVNKQRSHYLNLIWQPYPVPPPKHNVTGRIVAIEMSQIILQQQIDLPTTAFKISENWSEVLALGDWVSLRVESEQVVDLCLLSPCLLNHTEISTFQLNKEKLQWQQLWNQYISAVRIFFSERKFLEVQTPTLVTCPGTEPTLDVFSTEYCLGKERKKLYLPTSPELHLKKGLARGLSKVFEIRPCFRNNETGLTHLPEFWMIEWYRSFQDLRAIKQDVQDLVQYLQRFFSAAPLAAKSLLTEKLLAIDSVTIATLFKNKLNFELTPKTTAEDLKQLARFHKINIGSCESFDDLFFLLFLEKIEQQMGKAPLFVENYPPSQAALARLTEEGWGARFEFYWQGFEIANAFYELNDPSLQRLRFSEDLEKKKKLGKEIIPLDEEFLQALSRGMPPSAGIALGLDRLFMALFGLNDISQIRIF